MRGYTPCGIPERYLLGYASLYTRKVTLLGYASLYTLVGVPYWAMPPCIP